MDTAYDDKDTFVSLRGSPEIDVDPKYLNAELTPLSFEIVADSEPGRYDIAISK